MYNSVYLIGRLTKDPEIKETDNNKKVCNITLAVQRSYKNAEGIYETDFIRCSLWEAVASRACEFCHKGDLIAVRGQLRTSSYIAENEEKKYTTEIIVEKLVFLATKVPEKEESGQGTDTFDKKDCHDWCIFCDCNGASYI